MGQQSIGVTEARNNFSEIVDRAHYLGETTVLMKSGKPAAAIVPYMLLEQWQRDRAQLFALVDQVQSRNLNMGMDEDELMDFVNDAVHEVRTAAD
ncbi:MAG: type II toxin-antitoxin system Phd/YefM family antitoxin [Caldilineaceae bacterium]|nr:type II toxin-antitoxin system Phd/YefM family antitoxin [Caldilineaceae bacterium]MBP8108985.1 type II toxin-antitoxin system Phd/YefM family antitoxin [Caldilineaceae bacterium]MBP8124130.1 type II toxin-antitoxin system Phd/YefM family antitoxin [Caldilineaceae bacterium]MBP9071297.1 type II toxin-antitoxin system Phd/YefM family antitoxin [Caldilineaceae bacterium]